MEGTAKKTLRLAHKITSPIQTALFCRKSNDQVSLFFHFDNQASHVITALWANFMRWNGITAFGTMRNLLFLFVIVRTTGAGSGITVFSLGNSHFS